MKKKLQEMAEKLEELVDNCADALGLVPKPVPIPIKGRRPYPRRVR